MSAYSKIHSKDTVAVALQKLDKGQTVMVEGKEILLAEDIPQGHKFACVPMKKGELIRKYGFIIGKATAEIKTGAWVHTHNIATLLDENKVQTYQPNLHMLEPNTPKTINVFLRPDGRIGVRNEIWIIPTVGCVNEIAQRLEKENETLAEGNIEGVHAFTHPYGCSQMGDDHRQTAKLLASLVNHPNAGAVLVLGLGCENNNIPFFKKQLGGYDPQRVQFLECQGVADELETGKELLQTLAAYAQQFTRQAAPASKLVVGLKCGGSDGLSGITANPAVGIFSDLLVSMGGSTLLTEVPEMFGAEEMLLNRAASAEVYQKADKMINNFKQYYTNHGQVVYENPSPGNKEGGISTLEDKSLGCVQKGGSAPIVDVLNYAEPIRTTGLNLLYGPGNDLVSTTALTASGCHIILFTTGRGTPFGAPVPTIKIATNTKLYEKKPNWIDFNAGVVTQGEPLQKVGKELLEYTLDVASGKKQTSAEKQGYRGIAIFKDGVTL